MARKGDDVERNGAVKVEEAPLMRLFFSFLGSIAIGYLAEVYFQNPQQYVVWIGFSIITFGAYTYLTQITSFAFALPLTVILVSIANALAHVAGEPGIVIFGVYAAILILIFFGNRFHSWRWVDWKSPSRFVEALNAPRHTK